MEELTFESLDELTDYEADELEDFLSLYTSDRLTMSGHDLRRIQEALLQGIDPEDM